MWTVTMINMETAETKKVKNMIRSSLPGPLRLVSWYSARLRSQKFGSTFSRGGYQEDTLSRSFIFNWKWEEFALTGDTAGSSGSGKLQRGLQCCLDSESFISCYSSIPFASRPSHRLSANVGCEGVPLSLTHTMPRGARIWPEIQHTQIW